MISEFFTPGLIVELIVIILLAITATYCFVLNKKLRNLRDSQGQVRQTIQELNQATIRAENAINGLKVTTEDADKKLRDNLEKARSLSVQFEAMSRLAQRSDDNVTTFRKAS